LTLKYCRLSLFRLTASFTIADNHINNVNFVEVSDILELKFIKT